MPRNAAVTRNTIDAASGTAAASPASMHDADAAAVADAGANTITLALTHADAIAAWTALVQRCGGAQAAFEALVLLPSALQAAGIDPGSYMRCRSPR